jgi:fermentation-respiration switch protein FrsA (DUF1100 family)
MAGAEDYPVEDHFARRGPHGVRTESVLDPSGQALFELFVPDGLSASAQPWPIVTWGNGTLAQPHQYPGVLHQLASWGMAVVASMCKRTGKGHEMAAGIEHLRLAQADPVSPFFGRLDLGHVGAAGHSQGAGGTVNVATRHDVRIDAAVPICLPAMRWVSKGDEYDVGDLACPVLFLGGSRDRIIAGPSTLHRFFERAPAPAAVASLRGAGHNVIQKSGGGYLGYLTAWLRWHLFDDELAASAFKGGTPEFCRNRTWVGPDIKL